jgi:hypothetical protein
MAENYLIPVDIQEPSAEQLRVQRAAITRHLVIGEPGPG